MGARAQGDFDSLEGDAWTAAHAAAAEKQFAVWKETGKAPEELLHHAMRGERPDLQERVLSGDRLVETEIKAEMPAVKTEVVIHAAPPLESATKNGNQYSTVWRRITKDRFEVWTPLGGELFDAKGGKVAVAKVARGDGWGREWYGAFLLDGRWVTTDINERDDRLTMFSAKGKKLWSLAGDKLLPENEEQESAPLIAWARSDKSGKAWIVAVGADFGRGWVKVTPEGKSSAVDCPWKECFPQQLGKRGFYTSLKVMSDDGSVLIRRDEAGHGIAVGWPSYNFPAEASLVVPDGGRFGILTGGKTVFVEASAGSLTAGKEERKQERVWLFDTDGKYQHSITGRSVGAGLKDGGLWVRMLDDTAVRIDKEGVARQKLSFTEGRRSLIPVELHDDIGLGLFLKDDHLAVGTGNVLE